MSLFLAVFGLGFGLMGAQRKHPVSGGTPTGTGTVDFSTPDNSGLWALFEDI